MDTLRQVRPDEDIVVIDTNADPAFVMQKMKEQKDKNILVFVSVSDTVAEQVLSQIDPADSGYVFFPRDIDVNPLNNCMVPCHRLATNEEIQTNLLDRHIPLKKLPTLPMSDPIRRWYNFSKGSVVTIERKSSLYFRKVR
jgi:DNA-directed RNA polymerase subunit H (RpoH/RPB5)